MSPRPTIIGISGASGAGKSLFANQLHDRLRESHSQKDVSILNEDCYYRDRSDLSFEERVQINYDHPDALEHELLVSHLNELLAGKPVQVPQYDYKQHNRRKETVILEPSAILIVEGILILHEARLRELMDLKVYVEVPLDICLTRRLRRDIQERGRSLDSVLNQYETTVRPMFHEFIDPSKQHADLIVPRGGANKNALQVLHSHLHNLLS